MMISRNSSGAGFILIAVVVVLAMLSLSAYTFTHWVSLELEVVDLEGKRLEARHLAESGKSLIEAIAIAKQRGLPAPPLSNNLELFEGIVVEAPEDPASGEPKSTTLDENYARFSVFSPGEGTAATSFGSEAELVRFGLEREGGKIHLNEWMARNPVALGQALLQLPGSTTELVDAVLDWMDSDDDKRSGGAESAEYEALMPPMGCRNGPIDSLDELLLVKGMTREILYGEDTNYNGQLDPNEDDGASSPPFDDQDGQLSRGWLPYLTLYSREANLDAFGRGRIFLNDPDIGRLYGIVLSELGEEIARLVVAFRLFGTGSDAVATQPGIGKYAFLSPLQLIDLTVQGEWEGESVRFESPFRSSDAASLERFASIYDRMTVRLERELVGRLDLASATPESLALLTSLPEDKRTAILEQRPTSEANAMQPNAVASSSPQQGPSVPANETVIWLLRDGVLTVSELMGIENSVTMQSPVVRFQSAGFFDDAQTASRIEVVMMLDQVPPRVVMQRSLDRYGPGIPLPLLGQFGEKKELPSLSSESQR